MALPSMTTRFPVSAVFKNPPPEPDITKFVDFKLPFDNVKPPIAPAVAVIVPLILVLPLESTEKFGVVISNVPGSLWNFKKLVALPTKNLGSSALLSNDILFVK